MKIDEIERQNDWKLYVSRENVLLWRHLEAKGYQTSKLNDIVGIDQKINCKMTSEHLLCNPENIQDFSSEVKKRVEKDLDYFLQVSDNCYQLIDEFLDFCKNLEERDLSEVSDEELLSIFNEYVEKNTDMIPFRAVVFFLDRILDEKLDSKLEELDEVDFHIDMATPEKELPFLQERKSLLKIGKEIEQNEEIVEMIQNNDKDKLWGELPEKYKEKIEDHLESFEWITTDRYAGDPLEKGDVLDNLAQVVGRSSESLEKIEENREEKLAKLEEAKEEGDDELEKLLEIAQEYAYFRTYRMDAIYEGDYRVRNMFEEIAKRANLEYEDIINLTVPEIKELINGKEISSNIINSRNEEYIVYLVEDEISVIEGGQAEKHIPKVDEESQSLTEQARIEGTVAQRGQVESQVSLVFEDEDIEKVEKGDILVSPMTTPDMMVGIMDAKGIITDEGGMASHAAIVSRELGIPCIIGTKTATSILQDGDKVRIDAENGVVEILERCHE